MDEPIITTQALTRDFKHNRAVDSLNLSVQPGELFGLIGPDGAGKTTTLRLLAGLLKISSGSATISGIDLAENPEGIKPQIGYMAQQFSMYGELSVSENLHFFAALQDVSRKAFVERSESLLAFAGLTKFRNRRAGHLSGGMQKKLALACTLVHEPEILLLDEPTTGVDPISRREFWNILTELHVAGTTIVVSTPYMDEADRCSMVGLMYAGKLVVCAPPGEIRARIPGEMIELISSDWRAASLTLESAPGVLEIQTYGETLHILVDSAGQRLPELIARLERAGIVCHSARQAPMRMEEAFISLIRKMSEPEMQSDDDAAQSEKQTEHNELEA